MFKIFGFVAFGTVGLVLAMGGVILLNILPDIIETRIKKVSTLVLYSGQSNGHQSNEFK